MRSIIVAIGLFVLLPASTAAQILPPVDGYSVDVTFSDKLRQRLASINSLEQRFEERFRENRHYARSPRRAGTQRFAGRSNADTEWAGERLIGKVSDYTLENLVEAMVAYNVNRALPDFGGRIEIHIDKLQLSNPAIAFLESIQSYAAGRIKVIDPDGSVVFNDRVRANLVVDRTVDDSYDGPALAFVETDPSKRVGPTLAFFVKRALQQAWPEHQELFAGPIIVRVSGPDERVIIDPG